MQIFLHLSGVLGNNADTNHSDGNGTNIYWAPIMSQ